MSEVFSTTSLNAPFFGFVKSSATGCRERPLSYTSMRFYPDGSARVNSTEDMSFWAELTVPADWVELFPQI